MLTDKDDYERRRYNTRTRMLKARPFFGCYDTGFEYDVLDIMSTKYSLQRQNRVIGRIDQAEGFQTQLIDEYRAALVSKGVSEISIDDMRTALKDMGIDGSLQGNAGKLLRECGFRYKQNRQGNFYEIPEAVNG